jgi:hypothetical protein
MVGGRWQTSTSIKPVLGSFVNALKKNSEESNAVFVCFLKVLTHDIHDVPPRQSR